MTILIKTLDEMFAEFGGTSRDYPSVGVGWNHDIDEHLPDDRIITIEDGHRDRREWIWRCPDGSMWNIGNQMVKEFIDTPLPELKALTHALLNKISGWATAELYSAILENDPKVYQAGQAIDDPTKISFFNKLEHAHEWRALRRHDNHTEADLYRKKRAVMTRPGRFFCKFGIKDPQLLEVITSKFTNFTFEIVSGEDIRKYYLGSNYNRDEDTSLQSSCMKYDTCQEYFDFYVEHLKMVISKGSDDRILGRAILWEGMEVQNLDEPITFLDRIYGSDIFAHAMKAYAKVNGWYHKTEQNYHSHRRVTGPDGSEYTFNMSYPCPNEYNQLPYMDTMNHVIDGDHFNNSGNGRNLEGTDGNYSQACTECGCSMGEDNYTDDQGNPICITCYSDNYVQCRECNETTSINDVVTTHCGCAFCESCADTEVVFCECCGENHHIRDAHAIGDIYVCDSCYCDNADIECPECGTATECQQVEQHDMCASCLAKSEEENDEETSETTTEPTSV